MQGNGKTARPFTRVVSMLAALALGAAGCTNLRYYATYRYDHARTEKVRTPLKQSEYLSGIFREGGAWVLKVLELKRCEQKEVEIARETAVVTISSPTWYYYLGLGGLQTGLSTPFWVLGARAGGKDRRDNFLVGSFIFLVPGLAIMAIGAYLKLVSGTEEKPMGLRHRVKHRVEVACGTGPAAGRRVTLGTRTGPIELGKTDAQGRLPFPVDRVRPLVRWNGGDVEKVFFEVFVGDAPSQEVKVPQGYPVSPTDLREPTLRLPQAAPRRAQPSGGSPSRRSPPARRSRPAPSPPRRSR